MKSFIVVTLFLMLAAAAAPAQCTIGNPSTNAASWNNSLTIGENFNAARRWEETDRGLTPNCLGVLEMPPGGWASLTDEEIALYIHNDERTDRGLLPFYAVESNLTSIAQAHADWLIANDVFSHTGDPVFGTAATYTICPNTTLDGSTPVQRSNANPVLEDCHQYTSESLAFTVTSSASSPSFNNFVARSIYRLIYTDGGSMWAHRQAVFEVYSDDHGPMGSEGFIGAAVGTGTDYTIVPMACSTWAHVKILVLLYYDPKPSCNSFSFSVLLPVELSEFRAGEHNGTILLHWATATEQHSDFFSVEKSLNGLHFHEIGRVAAAGYSTERLEYDFTDTTPAPGTNYYRLRTVDFDGTVAYSKIVVVQVEKTERLAVFPNPFQAAITVQCGAGSEPIFMLEVYDLSGNRVAGISSLPDLDSTLHRLNLEWLPAGVYILHVVRESRRETLRIVKL